MTQKRLGRQSEEPNDSWSEKEAFLEKERLDKMLYLLGSQLGPLLDRTGRLFMDVSPHLAMQGQNIKSTYATYGVFDMHPLSMLSQSTRNRVRTPESNPPDPIARFLDPLSYSRSVYPERNSLSSMGQNLSFQVPVMLSPGELLSTNSRNNSFIGERDVHLHINAQVHMPGTLDSPASDQERHRRRERQEQQRHQTLRLQTWRPTRSSLPTNASTQTESPRRRVREAPTTGHPSAARGDTSSESRSAARRHWASRTGSRRARSARTKKTPKKTETRETSTSLPSADICRADHKRP